MSKKLTGNGLWESSRMMLPQHKETINRKLKEIHKKEKQELHEDEMFIIIENISISYAEKAVIRVRIFTDYGKDREVTGVVTSVNQYSKKFKVEFDESYEWIEFDEIVSVRLE